MQWCWTQHRCAIKLNPLGMKHSYRAPGQGMLLVGCCINQDRLTTEYVSVNEFPKHKKAK